MNADTALLRHDAPYPDDHRPFVESANLHHANGPRIADRTKNNRRHTANGGRHA